MKKYYCNGKKGFCDRYNGETEPNCNGCEFADGTGGNVIQSTTNYDRIRNMSVEEMADALMCPAEFDTDFNKERQCNQNRNCFECTKKYLESEVDTE